MTDDEVRKVAYIMLDADGGCVYCAASLLRQLAEAFPGPEHEAAIDEVWVADGNRTMTWKEE